MKPTKSALQVLAPLRMLCIALFLCLLCVSKARAQDASDAPNADNPALVENAPVDDAALPPIETKSPSFMGAVETTVGAWRDWLRSLSPYMVAGVGGVAAYFTGFVVFMIAFALGSYAPIAARSGLWVFAMIWFVLLAAVFIPLSAPWWWWLAAFSVVVVALALIPKPRAVT